MDDRFEHSAPKAHFVAMDGLRGIAAIAVLLFHRRSWAGADHFVDHGYLAVNFFFMLSGFVLAYAYRGKFATGLSLTRFMQARAIRLYPLVILGAIVGAAYILLKALIAGQSTAFSNTLTSLPFAMAGLPTLPGLMANPFDINSPTWSLFVELILSGAFAAFFVRLSRTWLIWATIASFLLMVVICKSNGGLLNPGTFRSLPMMGASAFYPFLIGMLIENAHRHGVLPQMPGNSLTAVIVLVAVFLVPRGFGGSAAWIFDVCATMLVFPYVIISAVGIALEGKWMVAASLSGEISYPLYILHVPLLHWFEAIATRVHLAEPAWLPVALPLIVAASFLGSRLYDVPLRRALTRNGSPASAEKRLKLFSDPSAE